MGELNFPCPPLIMENALPRVLALLALIGLASSMPAIQAAAQQPASEAPIIRKVEPPNWWTHFTPEVTLLLTGENLGKAQVRSANRGLAVSGSQSSQNGHYLFVHLTIADTLDPGTVRLAVQTPHGSATIEFGILSRPAETKFKSITSDDVIYLIMPDRFADGDLSNDKPPGSTGIYDRSQPKAYHGGDLRGIREHLAYLHDLGVTTLWLTPVWKNTDSDYHGYHVVNFYAIDDHMGSLAEYQGLIADAHKLGMKVLMDYVANHVGPSNAWASDPPTATWLHGSPAQHLDPAYVFSGLVDPHAPPRFSRATLEGWFAGKLPDMDPDDPDLGQYLAQNALWWAESAHLDGFRLDTFPYSSRQFWSRWHAQIRKTYPAMETVGEVWDHDPTVTSFFAGGRKEFDGVDAGVSTLFDFPLYFALRDVINKGDSVQKLIDVLRQDSLYPDPARLVTFIGNHDTKRFISEDNSGPGKLEAAFGLLLTMRGIPQIYSGDELGMAGGDDPDNRRDFPGGFPGDARSAFLASGRTPEQQEIFHYVQSLLELRKLHPALREGKQWHIGWDDSFYAFVRKSGNDELLVLYNNSDSPRSLTIPVSDTPLQQKQELQTIFGNSAATLVEHEVRTSLPPKAIAIFLVQ